MAEAAAPHVVVLPLQEQGHVTPSMELSHRLVEHGLQVSFVCTERIHSGLRHAIDGQGGLQLVPIPDGLADGDDRKDLGKSHEAFSRTMPGHLEELLRATKVKWLVADGALVGLCLEVAKKLGVKVACFFPMPAAYVGNLMRIPQLIQDGFIDDKGLPKQHGEFELAPNMPPLYTSQMPWCVPGGGPELRRAFFQMVCANAEAAKRADLLLFSSFLEAEATAFEVYPDMVPIGPMCTDRKAVGQLVPVDMGCLDWLDTRPDNSVLYVAFGSTTVFDSRQTRELAQGLELTGRPFLWVVRPDFTSDDSSGESKAWFDGFKARNAGNGMVVTWCPQQQVLAHRALGCFLSHCGWNSALEGLRSGLPVLCLPYIFDHFTARSYICDIWRTGLALSPGEDGVLTKEEVSTKVERIMADHGIAERARTLSDTSRTCLQEGGSSYENFKTFVTTLLKKD